SFAGRSAGRAGADAARQDSQRKSASGFCSPAFGCFQGARTRANVASGLAAQRNRQAQEKRIAEGVRHMSLFVTPRITIPDDELEERFIRSSGPGGQNVNKVSSAVQL